MMKQIVCCCAILYLQANMALLAAKLDTLKSCLDIKSHFRLELPELMHIINNGKFVLLELILQLSERGQE